MANPVDDRGNERVDHVWGNMPLQPDDQRPVGKKLDPALDNHVIATTGRYGFPNYTPNYVGDGDAIQNVVVPNVVGLTQAVATSTLTAAELVVGTVTTSGDGATAENDGTVKTQSPVAGANGNEGDAVDLVLYSV